MREYRTAQGDTWDIVSYREYGTEMRIAELIEANAAHRNTVIFPANVALQVPEVPSTADTAPAPPWRRADG